MHGRNFLLQRYPNSLPFAHIPLDSVGFSPVPDVFPDASNICTLLIKLGGTFKKVCLSLSHYYKSLRLKAIFIPPSFCREDKEQVRLR